MVLLACLLGAVGRADAAASSTTAAGNPAGQVYVHPEKQFSLAVPADAEIIERDEPVDISVRSRDGWLLHVQSAPRDPVATLNSLSAKLEAHYLGADRPWNAKLGERRALLAGLPALESVYEGSGSKARVVIVQTAGYDMVLMFIAPERVFTKVEGVFDAILASFRPPAGEAAPTAEAANEATEVPGESTGAFRTFREGPMGISVGYPGDWRIDQPSPYMVVFSGQSGPAAFANASIQNVAATAAANRRAAAGAVLQEIMAQLAYSVSDVRNTQVTSIMLHGVNGELAEGWHLLSEFNRVDTPYKQWSIALPRGDGAIVHVFTFVAPDTAFEAMRPVAEAMVQSWTLTPVAR